MLKKFAVTNFRGFADRIEWDLSNPSNYEFSQYAIKDGIVKNAIIYGPNGSGKSNFSFAVFDIVNHLTQKNKQDDYYVNFAHAAHLDSPVKFEYSFKLGEYDILYVYTKDIGGILLTEELTVNGKKIIRRKEKDITYDASLVINKKAMNTLLHENSNQVSVISFLLASIPFPSTHYLIKLRDFVNSMLWFRNLDERGYIGLQTGGTNLEEYFTLASKYGLSVMLTLGNDCCVPKELYVFDKDHFGEQKVDWGYHSGIKRGQHSGTHGSNVGYLLMDEDEYREKFFEMVDELAKKYSKDERLLIWNVWNEIGANNRGTLSLPLMEKR